MARKLLAALAASFMIVGLFGGAALAGHDGDNGHKNSDKGHCTAYFNGQKKGHEKQKERNGEYPGPFQDLEDRAEENAPENNDEDDENDVSGAEAIASFCGDLVGGNPENGRYGDCFEDGVWTGCPE